MVKIDINNKNLQKIQEEKNKCINCKLCMKGCPMLSEFCNSPKDLLEHLLSEKKADHKLPYSCLLCGYCTAVCPKGVDLKEIFFNLRENIVSKTKGKLPRDLGYTSVKFHQINSFSRFFRTDIIGLGKDSDIIYFPGCSIMAYSPEIVFKAYKYLRELIPGIGIYLNCCGNPTFSMGYVEEFNQYYDILREEFKKNGIKRVVTTCQNCFITIKENSKDIQVIPIWEIISKRGVPKKVKGKGKDVDIVFSIHDPCPTRHEIKTHDAIRDILDQIGINYTEMKFNRENTLCCGSGGMASLTNNKIATAQKMRRANETKEEYIVTYCEECVGSMKKSGKSSVHILDLLFNEDIYNTFNQVEINTAKKWINRYKGKKMFNNQK
ncbi:MAG: Putative iron-sulfur protein [Sporanaerobacter sp.]|jgi:Fe-S oxidoreductase|uniref:(Fe-S)-binding protein n=1 Tax=Sporanaerobacter sp. TaxID=2010183 RepID=UPI003A101A5C